MIKIENTVTPSPEQWEIIILGARNAMNSWDRSDSDYRPILCKRCDECQTFLNESWDDCDNCEVDILTKKHDGFMIGPNDHDLMMRLAKGGPVHAKYRRMLEVYCDITAPLYWLAELDTYKIGTVKNSCSFMHKGVSKPFDITDFSIKNEKIYEALKPLEKKNYRLTYPYETDDFKIYTDINGRTYRVYRNGRVIREAFDYVDNWGKGRTRHFEEKEATIYQNSNGYFIVKLSGRPNRHISLHKLVALMWCEKPEGINVLQVDHKDTNKGNNSAENLEWVIPKDNMRRAVDSGLYDNLSSLHRHYRSWKNNHDVIPNDKRLEFKIDVDKGLTHKELAEKYNITPSQANNIRSYMRYSGYEDLFQECYIWDRILTELNYLRDLYLETKDEQVFQAIRCLLPQGYTQRSTYMFNYEVLANIYHSRKDHRLDEWRDFCNWIQSLPYSEIITGEIETED